MPDDKRILTAKEKKWAGNLLRCLNAMPPGIEICVTYSGSVEIRNLGADKRYFDEHGHVDNVPSLTALLPKTCRRIDGRDSSL